MTGSVYFVDDNFIGNRKAALDLLPHLVEWQKKTGYVMRLACEATLNIAKRPEILEKMREAYFVTIFCGIETPDPDALKAMQKDHNMMVPILEGVHTINSYGMEVVSGIIMGLDTDKPETGDALLAFIEESQIPLLTINLLQALPKTPLWDRLRTRKPADRRRRPRFQCRFPAALRPGRQFAGANAWKSPTSRRSSLRATSTSATTPMPTGSRCRSRREQKSWANIKRGLIMLRNIFWKVGVLGDYRRVFWKFALARLRQRRHRRPDRARADRASPDHVRARWPPAGSRTPRTIRSGCARPRSPPSNASMKAPAPPSRSLRICAT